MTSEWLTPDQIRMRRAAEVMESSLGTAIYEATIWARKQVPMVHGDEIWLNPQDEGALALIGGNLMGYLVCASTRVPSGEALVFCRSLGVYVRNGEEPTRWLDRMAVLAHALGDADGKQLP